MDTDERSEDPGVTWDRIWTHPLLSEALVSALVTYHHVYYLIYQQSGYAQIDVNPVQLKHSTVSRAMQTAYGRFAMTCTIPVS